MVKTRTSTVQHTPGHAPGHLGGLPSSTNVHGQPKGRVSTTSASGRGAANEDSNGAASPNATGALAAISEAHGATGAGPSAGGDGAPSSARRRAGTSASGKSHPGIAPITQRAPPGSIGVPRDEPPREYNSYMEMTLEAKQQVAEAIQKYQQVKVETALALRKIQSVKREAFVALEKERKQTLNGAGWAAVQFCRFPPPSCSCFSFRHLTMRSRPVRVRGLLTAGFSLSREQAEGRGEKFINRPTASLGGRQSEQRCACHHSLHGSSLHM